MGPPKNEPSSPVTVDAASHGFSWQPVVTDGITFTLHTGDDWKREVDETPPPWNGASLHGVGWIPSADGHLSFSLIGHELTPGCAAYSAREALNGDGDPTAEPRQIRQRIAVFQKRINWDIPKIVRVFIPSSKHHWLLVGETQPARYETDRNHPHPILDEQGMLQGSIYLLPYQAKLDGQEEFPSRDAKRKAACSKISRELNTRRKRDDLAPFGELDEALKDFRPGPQQEGQSRLDMVEVKFCMFRTGESHFWLEESEYRKVAGNESPLPDAALIGREEFPKANWVLKQAFYFAKDVAHSHAHHNSKTDQILPLVVAEDEANDGADTPSYSGLRWQRETLWSLSRTIEELVRSGGRRQLRNAIGIIAFAESFQSVIAKHVRKTGYLNEFVRVEDFHQYDFKSLRESVRTMLERKTWNLAILAAMAGSLAALLLAGVIATNAIVGPSEPGQSVWGTALPGFLRNYPFAGPAIPFFALLVTYFNIVNETARTNPLGYASQLERGFGLAVRALAQGFTRKLSESIRYGIAAGIAGFLYLIPITLLSLIIYWLLRSLGVVPALF